jgi:hypothetical protein
MTSPSNDDDMDMDILRLAERPAEPGQSCLGDSTIAALAEGSIDAQKRAEALPHLASCAVCRTAVLSVSQALTAPDIAREVAATRATPRRLYRSAIPLAAAAALLLIVVWPRSAGRDASHRAPPPSGAPSAPVAVGPVGVVARPPWLTWAAVPGADRYRVVLFDSDGRVLYEQQQTDTVATLPDSVVLVPGRRYAWKVDARLAIDRWNASPLTEFSIGGSTR